MKKIAKIRNAKSVQRIFLYRNSVVNLWRWTVSYDVSLYMYIIFIACPALSDLVMNFFLFSRYKRPSMIKYYSFCSLNELRMADSATISFTTPNRGKRMGVRVWWLGPHPHSHTHTLTLTLFLKPAGIFFHFLLINISLFYISL
jgi:hypothetical protein